MGPGLRLAVFGSPRVAGKGKGRARASAQGRANGKAEHGQDRSGRFVSTRPGPGRPQFAVAGRGQDGNSAFGQSGQNFGPGKTETVVGSARDKRHPGRHGVVKVGDRLVAEPWCGSTSTSARKSAPDWSIRRRAGFCASPHKRARPCPRSVRRATNEPLLLEKRPRSGG